MNTGELVTVKTIEKNTLEKHTPYSAEIRLFSCVRQGDIDSLMMQIKNLDSLTNKNEIFMCLGIEILKLTQDVNKNKKQPEFSPHIRNCIRYINENLGEKISVSAVAEYCEISADYLSQIFKKEIGENLSSYILRQKLEKAKKLLLDGINSKEICREVGFSSQAYFVTVFKRFYNMTPSEYIKITRIRGDSLLSYPPVLPGDFFRQEKQQRQIETGICKHARHFIE